MSSKPPKPVYILHGQDDYLRRRHRRQIIQALVGSAEPELAVASFDDKAEVSEVLDELRTLPFLAPRRVVVVYDADAFVTRCRGPLEGYLRSPASGGSLILEVSTWPASTKLARLSREIGEVIDCSSPPAGSLRGWIERAAGERGKRIAPQAAGVLAEWVGPDLARVDSEVEKLALYVGPRRDITAEDVARAVVATVAGAPFALTDAIAAADAAGALKALGALLARRGEEFRVMGLIGWHLRSRAEGGRRGGPPARGQAATPGGTDASRRDFRRLLQADLAMKTGSEPLTTMQLLVVRLCGLAR